MKEKGIKKYIVTYSAIIAEEISFSIEEKEELDRLKSLNSPRHLRVYLRNLLFGKMATKGVREIEDIIKLEEYNG